MKTAIILAVILGVTAAQNHHHQGRNFQNPNQAFHNTQQQQHQNVNNRNSYDHQNQNQNRNYQPQEQSQPQRHYDEQDNRGQGSSSLADRQKVTTTPIPILQWNKQQEHDGTYRASYETGNNIIAEESGYIKTIGQGEDATEALVQQGSYSFMTPDGQLITTHYTADETGFHVQGDHIPTPPPVSEEIQKGLDLIYAGIRQQQEADEREARLKPNQHQPLNQQIDRREEDERRYQHRQ